MPGGTKQNRGPSAGPANRAALISAAREIFGERGFEAPLSAIAKRAGVGQGSLYRHFPNRSALATAVFDENMAQIEALVENPESTLRDVVDLVTHQAEGTAALLTSLQRTFSDEVGLAFSAKLRNAVKRKWDQADGLVGPNTTVDDVMTAIGLVAGAVIQAPANHRGHAAEAAWALIERGLAK